MTETTPTESFRDPKTGYLIGPDPSETSWPKGVKYIIGNEGCERFSFYGMKSVLQVHLTALFVGQAAMQNMDAEAHAQEMVHLFVAAVYAFPMIGAIIADRLAGKYHTILFLSLVYCLGHFVLALAENTILGMQIGLGLIAIGSGGIKPCVSAHVGDQFGKGNWHLVEKVFQAFYFIINFGSFFATLAIPWIRQWEMAHPWSINVFGHDFHTSIAFGLPGLLMLFATIMFWMGRKVFVHVPANPGGKLGLLDTLCSSALFLGLIGLPMFFMDMIVPTGTTGEWAAFAAACGVCVAIGTGLFYYRQSLREDNGFLAITLFSIQSMFNGNNSSARAEVGSDEPKDSVRRSFLFAAAAKKFDDITAEGPRAVMRIVSVFLLVSVFWALFDQHASSWIRQAQQMDLDVSLGFTSLSLLPSQISALNPLMVMALIPFNNFFLYPTVERMGFKLTPLRRMTIGMFVASLAFVTVAVLQGWIDTSADQPSDIFRTDQGVRLFQVDGEWVDSQDPESIKQRFDDADGSPVDPATGAKLVGVFVSVAVLWQVIPYLIMTLSEVMVSITGLEFAYTQAPKRMKSTIMGFWLLTVALGNKLVAIVTKLPDMPLQKFFWFFAGLMAVAAVIFAVRAAFYQYKDYSQ